MESGKEEYYVLGQLVAAVNLLAGSPKAWMLLPEIRSNPVMAKEGAKTPEEVAGIPGRITAVFGRITAPAYPAWGASKYTARILLAVMKHEPMRRAAMEIRYSPELVDLLKREGVSIARLEVERGGTLEEMIERCRTREGLPLAFYTEGGVAREGVIILPGREIVEVAALAVRIAELL